MKTVGGGVRKKLRGGVVKKLRKPLARVVVESFTNRSGVILQRELVRCGKPLCKRCRRRAAHGPYWYAYQWSRSLGRLVSRYRGKTLQPDQQRELVRQQRRKKRRAHGGADSV